MAAVKERPFRFERATLGSSKSFARLLASVHPELWVFTAALLLLNLHLIPGLREWAPSPQIFLPERVRAGEAWRLITHVFVHTSWLHWLLDGVAFVILYASLGSREWTSRVLTFAACTAGGLIAAWLDPRSGVLGYCGLSGAAHGLMAVSALEMLKPGSSSQLQGGLCLAIVGGKCAVELVTGQCAFGSFYGGLMGIPLVGSHAGGFLAGVAWFAAAGVAQSVLRNATRSRISPAPSAAARP